jgi:hypothetical protein
MRRYALLPRHISVSRKHAYVAIFAQELVWDRKLSLPEYPYCSFSSLRGGAAELETCSPVPRTVLAEDMMRYTEYLNEE